LLLFVIKRCASTFGGPAYRQVIVPKQRSMSGYRLVDGTARLRMIQRQVAVAPYKRSRFSRLERTEPSELADRIATHWKNELTSHRAPNFSFRPAPSTALINVELPFLTVMNDGDGPDAHKFADANSLSSTIGSDRTITAV
jgi:hypothetical protein